LTRGGEPGRPTATKARAVPARRRGGNARCRGPGARRRVAAAAASRACPQASGVALDRAGLQRARLDKPGAAARNIRC